MCTALFYAAGGGYMGRTLDLEYGYGEQVTVTPRGYLDNRYGMVGMAAVADGYPLYYDGVNEAGLAMAGLNFPHSARYAPPPDVGVEVAVHRLIPTLLGRCESVDQAVSLLRGLVLCDRPFSDRYPTASLHWMLADAGRSVVVESTADGVRIMENPARVLTNEPPLPHQLSHLSHYANLTPAPPQDAWQQPLSRGGGTVGLPGDFSSPARFVRGAYVAAHAAPTGEPISQVFRMMAAVAVPSGCVLAEDGRPVITRYTACMDLRGRAYLYSTYGCHRLRGVALRPSVLEGSSLTTYPLPEQEDILWEN